VLSDYEQFARPVARNQEDEQEDEDLPMEFEAAPAWQDRIKNMQDFVETTSKSPVKTIKGKVMSVPEPDEEATVVNAGKTPVDDIGMLQNFRF